MVLRVTREQVLGYRIVAHGLLRAGDLDEPAVLDIGVQDTPLGSARLALAARGVTLADALADDDGPYVLAWTLRGAPHLHRPADLRSLALALWPRSDADGLAKIAWQRSRLQATGVSIHDALSTTAAAMRDAIGRPTVKGAASAAVTARIPAALSAWCRPCSSTHVFEALFRMAALPGGLQLVPDASPATLAPMEEWPGVPTEQAGVSRFIHAYLRLLGPAGPAEVAGWLSTTQAELRPVWPDDLVEVEVDGRKAWLPPDRLDALRTATRQRLVRLLPPSDPYLQARDRNLLVPDKAAQKVLWPVLGPPGAVLVDGEIAGAWRAKSTRRDLQIKVTLFGPLDPHTRKALEVEADLVAQTRQHPQASLSIS